MIPRYKKPHLLWLLFFKDIFIYKHLTMNKFFMEIKYMLSSEDSNKLSSKRVITFMAFICVSIVFLTDSIFDISVDANMFNGMIQIVWAGLGVTVGEHLLKKRHNNTTVGTTTTVEFNTEEDINKEEKYNDF